MNCVPSQALKKYDVNVLLYDQIVEVSATYCKLRSDLAASELQNINMGENVRVCVCPTDFNHLSSSAT